MNILQPWAGPLRILVNICLMNWCPYILVVYIAQCLVKKLLAYLQSHSRVSDNVLVPAP